MTSGKELEPLAAAKRLLELDFPKQELADAILKAIQAGRFFSNEVIVEVVCKSTSKALYSATKAQLFGDRQALLQLHQQGYPDPAIEIRLCETLHSLAADDLEPYRQCIAESLRDHGTLAALPTLNAILFEQRPSLQTMESLAEGLTQGATDAEEYLLLATTPIRRQFFAILRDGIESIERRGISALVLSSTVEDEVVARILEHQRKAWEYLETNPAASLNSARKAAEAICKDIYRRQGLEEGKRPAKGQTLDTLLVALRQNKQFPALADMHISAIQDFGNFGSHDQEADEQDLTTKTVRAVLDHLDEAMTWFESARNEQPRSSNPVKDAKG